MIGLIGIGGMGSGMLKTLIAADYSVCAFDIDPERLDWASGNGAETKDNPKELIASCNPVLLSLPSSRVTVQTFDELIIPFAQKGQTIIDLGTTIASQTRRIYTILKEQGVYLLDAPVSGGTAGSAAGKLFIFVGGDREIADTWWPLLEVLGGQRLSYCGAAGSGQIVKGVNQLAMGITGAAMLEAIAFGVNGGVDIATIRDAVGDTGEGFRANLADMCKKIIDEKGDTFDNKHAEFDYFLDESRTQGYPMPILETLAAFLRQFPKSHRDNMNRPYTPYWDHLLREEGHSD